MPRTSKATVVMPALGDHRAQRLPHPDVPAKAHQQQQQRRRIRPRAGTTPGVAALQPAPADVSLRCPVTSAVGRCYAGRHVGSLLAGSAYRAPRSRSSTLPLVYFGGASVTTTCFGVLNPARRSPQCARTLFCREECTGGRNDCCGDGLDPARMRDADDGHLRPHGLATFSRPVLIMASLRSTTLR